MKRIVLTLLMLGLASISDAQPTVTNVTPTAVHGQTITITGTGFGTKTQAAPLKFDNFEGGTLGANIANGWALVSYDPLYHPIYSNTQLRANSTRSAQARLAELEASLEVEVAGDKAWATDPSIAG